MDYINAIAHINETFVGDPRIDRVTLQFRFDAVSQFAALLTRSVAIRCNCYSRCRR